ncbi:MAG: F0F1 ATP synthase subunit A [Chloroflexota bacterium]|nr:F0F1 ATP synthase subunit A [Chloroflexota bacterium]
MEGFFPQEVFYILGMPVRDTVISTWIMMVLVVGAAAVIGRRRPALLEMLLDFLIDTISEIMSQPSTAYLPFLGTLTIFIAVANVFGVLPSIPLPNRKMIPIVSPTRDINTPVALALIVFFSVYYFGIRAKGLWGYFKDLASPIFMLPMELISHVSRTLSLTLRLFGNIISTELIVAVIFSLIPPIVPLLLIAFSMLTGVLQAYIFTVLAAVYIGSGVEVRKPVSEESQL